MIRRPPRSTRVRSSAASDVYKRQGYPQGLKGSDIPLFGRIVAIADVFDALTCERPYKRAWPVAEAVREIISCSDRHFDPELVAAFLRVVPDITAVQQQFADT